MQSNKDLNLDTSNKLCTKVNNNENNNSKTVSESLASSSDTEDDFKTEEALQREHNESLKVWFEKISQMQIEIQKKLQTENALKQAPKVKYQDLPYMGEMTLDNSKPRRGRKPKKADICHLIYKNYGTVFPKTAEKPSSLEAKSDTHRTNVQNRIISSLLERRLTQQETKRQKSSKWKPQSEPLNLCVRDLDQLNLRLNLEKTSAIKTETPSDEDETPSPASSTNVDFKYPLKDFSPPIFSPQDLIKAPENGAVPGGYVYWPNAGVFIHQMALQQQLLYYQKMTGQNLDPMDLLKLGKSSDAADDANDNFSHKLSKRSNEKSAATKRKRSAIFIPPIPAENQNNPATEVSICKFKFTGGAKPSLQEKKMLSVDSGGNFRYYSGTGDKSMRGYEFFPRETLQQQIHNTQGSSTGAFLQASGEKIYPTSPMEFANSPTLPADNFLLTPAEVQASSSANATVVVPDGVRNKKRKSRKSLQREKLEQTFKEKGFLIQTQQLESAEGATYCKFRQLRKFTRYLFRSWKDYLPGNVADNLEAADKQEVEGLDQDLERDLSNSLMDDSPSI